MYQYLGAKEKKNKQLVIVFTVADIILFILFIIGITYIYEHKTIKIITEDGEQLITLITCEYSQENGRMVVVAKKES